MKGDRLVLGAIVAAAVLAAASPLLLFGGEASRPPRAPEPFAASGAPAAGLCVYLGVDDGRRLAELARGQDLLVQGLASDQAAIDRAREHLQEQKLYGRVSVKRSDLKELPYADNLVDHLLIDDAAALLDAGLSPREVFRVTSPNGAILFRGLSEEKLKATLAEIGLKGIALQNQGEWLRAVKARPAEMDDWTHFAYDASGTRVSRDAAIGPLSGLRWITGPYGADFLEGKHSLYAMVSAGGRIFYLTWLVPENYDQSAWERPLHTYLVARNAYNGLRLWTRPFPVKYERYSTAVHGRKDFRKYTRDPFRPYTHLIVAAGDRLYALLGSDVVAMDGATGETVLTFERGVPPPPPGADSPTKLVVHKDNLVLAGQDAEGKTSLRVRDLKTGGLRWKQALAASEVIVGEERLFVTDETNKSNHVVACFDLSTGKEIWRITKKAAMGRGWTHPYWFYAKGVLVFVGAGGNVQAFSAADGKALWSATSPVEKSFPCCAQGLIWVRKAEKEAKPGKEAPQTQTEGENDEEGGPKKKTPGRYFEIGLDPQTGEVRRQIPHGGLGGGCFRNYDLEDYVLGGRPVTLVSRQDGTVHRFVGRIVCDIGGAVANGLMYSSPTACHCIVGIRGFPAYAPPDADEKEAKKMPPEHPLLKGPAYADRQAAETCSWKPETEWPAYRHDPRRSGSTKAAIPADFQLLWKAGLGESKNMKANLQADWASNPLVIDDPLTQVAAADLAVVAAVESHRVVGLDVNTGQVRWTFVADGRVTLAPTLFQGLCLFGAADGWTYCLRAKDGKLAWRYRAAPREKQLMAYGQLESKWPVIGGVVVENGVAYCLAGQQAAFDGGAFFHALDPATGKCLKTQPFKGDALTDLLISSGRSVSVAGNSKFAFPLVKAGADGGASAALRFSGMHGFDRMLHKTDLRRRRFICYDYNDFKVPKDKLLDRPLPLKAGEPDTYSQTTRMKGPESWESCTGDLVVGVPGEKRAFAYREGVFMKDKDLFPQPGNAATKGSQLVATDDGKVLWSVEFPPPLQIQSLILTSDLLFAAGPVNGFQTGKDGILMAFSAKEGKLVKEIRLETPPVWDGLSAANGRLFVATRDGKVLCFGNQGGP